MFGLLLIASAGLKAQDASAGYEYAELYTTVTGSGEFVLLISYSDRETETISTGFKQLKVTTAELHDASLKEVGKKVKEGWTIVNETFSTSNNPVFLLRRKKQ